jgi:hypothetical protein
MKSRKSVDNLFVRELLHPGHLNAKAIRHPHCGANTALEEDQTIPAPAANQPNISIAVLPKLALFLARDFLPEDAVDNLSAGW